MRQRQTIEAPSVAIRAKESNSPKRRYRKRHIVLGLLALTVLFFVIILLKTQRHDTHTSLMAFVEQLARAQVRSSFGVDDVGPLRIHEPFAVCEPTGVHGEWAEHYCVVENEKDTAYLTVPNPLPVDPPNC